jgi:hypothetical protein
MTPLFCTLDSQRIADLIRSAERFVCYAGPGMQMAPAQAMAEVAGRLGVEMVTVALDFDERVMRMGFGDMQAVRTLREAGIRVNDAPGLRTALVLVDDEGYLFTPPCACPPTSSARPWPASRPSPRPSPWPRRPPSRSANISPACR